MLLAAMSCGSRRPSVSETESPYLGPIRSSDVARGRSRYHVVCGTCHDARLAPAIFEIGWSAAEVRHQVREGSALMPPIRPERLNDDDLEALLAFFVTIGTVIEAAPTHPTLDAGSMAPLDAGIDAGPDPIGAGLDPPLDGGTDAMDTPADAGADAMDADPDAGADADPDAGADADPDAGADAGPEAGNGAGVDAWTVDAEEPDAGRLPGGRDLSSPSRPPDAGHQ